MKTNTTGMLIDGVVQLDELVDVPNNCRVAVEITSIEELPVNSAEAWRNLKRRLKERPIHANGQRFTREQLHERG